MGHPQCCRDGRFAQKKSGSAGKRKRHEAFGKGLVLSNCGQLGLDWNDVSLSSYLEATQARQDAMEPQKDAEASDWLRQRVNGGVN